jgi:hypothetical protein
MLNEGISIITIIISYKIISPIKYHNSREFITAEGGVGYETRAGRPQNYGILTLTYELGSFVYFIMLY